MIAVLTNRLWQGLALLVECSPMQESCRTIRDQTFSCPCAPTSSTNRLGGSIVCVHTARSLCAQNIPACRTGRHQQTSRLVASTGSYGTGCSGCLTRFSRRTITNRIEERYVLPPTPASRGKEKSPPRNLARKSFVAHPT